MRPRRNQLGGIHEALVHDIAIDVNPASLSDKGRADSDDEELANLFWNQVESSRGVHSSQGAPRSRCISDGSDRHFADVAGARVLNSRRLRGDRAGSSNAWDTDATGGSMGSPAEEWNARGMASDLGSNGFAD